MSRGFEALHDPLASSGRLVRILRPIVEAFDYERQTSVAGERSMVRFQALRKWERSDEEGEEAAPNVRARTLNRSAYSAGACRKPSAPETDLPARSSGKSGVKWRSRSAFVTTKTEENAMAPAASIGDRRMPKAG